MKKKYKQQIFFSEAIVLMSALIFSCNTRVKDPLKDIKYTNSLQVYDINPHDGTAFVPVNAVISITFNNPMTPGTVSSNALDSACTGNIQVSPDEFSTCIRMSGTPFSDNGNITFTVVPGANLGTGTMYKIRVLSGVTDIYGNIMGSDYTTPAGFTTSTMTDGTPPMVFITDPYDNSGSINVNSAISVTFNEAMNPSTITTNTADTSCSGTFQVSSDNFATCNRMAGAPYTRNNNIIFSVVPGVNLATGTVYKIRIKGGVRDVSGNSMSSDYTTPAGFTTNSMADVTSPMIFITDPYDSSSSINVNSAISVTFNEAMNPSTITTNTADTSCSGSFQVSSDNFATCIRMAGAPYTRNSNITFSVVPGFNLATGTVYKIRIKSGVRDVSGNSMSSDYTTPAGFTTNSMADVTPPIIFITEPYDSAGSINVNSPIHVTFNEAMNPLTITTNTADTSCTGSFQVSSDNFASCIRMNGQPFSDNGDFSFRVVPAGNLATGTNYKIRMTAGARDNAGNSIGADYITPAGFTTALSADLVPPGIFFIEPADGAIEVLVNSDISVTFTESIDALTMTSNFTDTICSGSFQVSSDNFATCLQMRGLPFSTNGNLTFTVVPVMNFFTASNYMIKLTTAIKDAAGNPIAAEYVSTLGFSTASSTDTNPPQIFLITPGDGTTAIPVNTVISVKFNEAMNTGTITTNTADATCSGTLQVSSDSFATCIQMTAPPVISQGDKKFIITPISNLTNAVNYRIRILSTVSDAAGNNMGTVYQTPNGFVTAP